MNLKVGRPSKAKEDLMSTVLDKKEATVRMNINLPKSLHKRLKMRAVEQEATITEIILKHVEDIVSE